MWRMRFGQNIAASTLDATIIVRNPDFANRPHPHDTSDAPTTNSATAPMNWPGSPSGAPRLPIAVVNTARTINHVAATAAVLRRSAVTVSPFRDAAPVLVLDQRRHAMPFRIGGTKKLATKSQSGRLLGHTSLRCTAYILSLKEQRDAGPYSVWRATCDLTDNSASRARPWVKSVTSRTRPPAS
jgi:hypothetical protein